MGDEVLIYDIDKNATVLAPPNKDGVVLVQAGIIKTRVDIKNLRLLKSKLKPNVPKFASTRSVPSRMDVRPETEVDVRGQTAFEAVAIVDKAIDNAVLAGVTKLTIIHGKGTGVLRREINFINSICTRLCIFKRCIENNLIHFQRSKLFQHNLLQDFCFCFSFFTQFICICIIAVADIF